MVSKNPNLLEAFQTATSSSSDKGKAIGGPFVPPVVEDEGGAGDGGGEDLDGARSPELPGGVLTFVLALLLFAGGVFVGRLTAPVAIAGEGEEGAPAGSILPATQASNTAPAETRPRPPLSSSAGEEPARRTPGAPLTPREKLLDPANTYTAIAITYGKQAEDRQSAQTTAGLLVAQGFEAVAVRERGGMALVLVGAAPDLASMVALCERLSTARDDRNDLAFDDAYPVNIDDFIDR